MRCAICGIQIESIDRAVDQGWTPYFYDGKTEHEVACPNCREKLLRNGEDGEMEVKEEYRGKIRFLDEGKAGESGGHLSMGIAFKEPAGKKH
jgi:DNA-directed RNA polymerase subunit RPC12/RpoP